MTTWVLLRGLTREAAHWGDFPARLGRASPGDAVLALDLAGAGTQRGAPVPVTVEALAHDCRERLRRQGVAPPVRLLGLSLGGMVAHAWTTAWPAEVSRCVLVNTSIRPYARLHERLRPAAWLPLLALLGRHDARAIERRILQWTSSRPGDHAAVLDDWVAIRRSRPVAPRAALAQLRAAARYRAPVPTSRVPTLVLCSAGDRLVDPACSRRLAAHHGWPLEVHPDAGHDLPLDDPDWLVDVTRRWLASPA